MNESEIKKEFGRVASFGPLLASQMTLRDYFAIHASELGLDTDPDANYHDQACERYKFADAMMKARDAA